jgi:hypothetical protein
VTGNLRTRSALALRASLFWAVVEGPGKSRTIEADLNKPWRHPSPYIRGNADNAFGDMVMKNPLLCMTAAVSLVALTSVAQARSAYDGSWDLLFVTQRGACDPTYNFSVNITNGIVTHPNLVKFRGSVARSGAVRASVTVQDKYASGSGRLSSNSGSGRWSGYSGSARCSGYWTAQRN